MRRKRQSKAEIRGKQRNHAKKRAFERYGIQLSSSDYEEMLQMIRVNGAAHLVRKISNTRSIFNLLFRERDIFCVYNGVTGRIVTFLTIDQAVKESN